MIPEGNIFYCLMAVSPSCSLCRLLTLYVYTELVISMWIHFLAFREQHFINKDLIKFAICSANTSVNSVPLGWQNALSPSSRSLFIKFRTLFHFKFKLPLCRNFIETNGKNMSIWFESLIMSKIYKQYKALWCQHKRPKDMIIKRRHNII